MPNRKISQLERTQALSTKDFLPVLRADGAGGWANKRINSGDLAFALKKLASSVSSISFLDKPGKHPAFSHSRPTVGALCQQFDGSFYQPQIGEIGSHGMRRVENLRHADPAVGVGATQNATVSGNDITLSASGNSFHYLNAGAPSAINVPAGVTVFYRVTIACAAGTRTIGLRHTGSSISAGAQAVTVGPDPTEFWVAVETTATGTFSFGLENRGVTGGIDPAPGTFTITEPFIQIARPGQTIPDPEYVSRGVVTEDMLGPELVANGTFDTDTSGWTLAQSTLAVVGQELEITSTLSSYAQATQTFANLLAGQSVLVSGEVTKGAGPTSAKVDFWNGSAQIGVATDSTGAGASGQQVFQITGGTPSLKLNSFATAPGQTSTFDNVSIRRINYHGWGVDGVQCFATDEYGNDLTVATPLGPDRTGFSLAPSGSNPAAVLAPYGWSTYNSPTTVEVLNGADLHIVSNGSNQGAYWRPTVRAGQVFEMTFEIVGDPGSILITDGSPEPGYSTGAKAPGHHTLRFRALLNGYLNLFLRANTNTAGETTFAGMTIREVYPVRAAGAVRNPAITNSFPVMNKPAANWELAGTTPPVSISDTTLNGLPAVTIRFQSGGDVGYNGCRAANNGAGNHMAIASGKYATMRARIKLSRALTGLESIYFYSTGTGGFEDGFTISAGNSADFTGPNGGYVYTNRRTPFVSAASQYGVFYPSTALTADVDVTINEFQGIALDAQPEVDFVLPSPPVLTVNTSVALAADEDSLDAVAAGWDQSNGGVIALRMRQLYGLSTGKIGRICSVGSNVDNRVFLYLRDGDLLLSSNLGGVSQGAFGAATPFTIGEDSTVVMRVEANALRVWVDGVLLISDTSFSVPPASQIVFCSDGAINSGAGELGIAQREAFIFPPGTLTDAECLSLSTGHLPHIPELV